MEKDKPLVNKYCLLEKFEGKSGWTYTQVPAIIQAKKSPFGWISVCGSIDNYELNNYNLMPMKNGNLFLPIKADIRKKIKKKAGDYVQVILFTDDSPIQIPEDLKLCLLDEPTAYEAFLTYTRGEQKACIEWINSAKTEDTKIERIARTIDKIVKGKKWTGKKQRTFM